MKESIRIKANINDDIYLTTNLTQTVKSLDVLSININQSDLYNPNNAKYGCVIGRVNVNNGVGVPNAKLSIFIPKDEVENNEIEESLYPFETVYDVDGNGTRYNLLQKSRENTANDCYTPVGTLPTKEELLDNKVYENIYKKYYKYTTTTNQSGDYILMGVPLGSNTIIHLDVDMSDVGDFLSLKPYDYISNGVSKEQFKSTSQFKTDNNLDNLIQIISLNKSIDVRPFWGQDDERVGINRVDFTLPINIQPTALVAFGNFTDEKLAISRNCRPRSKQGRNCNLKNQGGQVSYIKRIASNSNQVELFEDVSTLIDENGNAVFPVVMNLKKMITDEFGNLVESIDGRGIATESLIRMKSTLNGFGSRRRTASYLIPNLYNNFHFGSDTIDKDFFKMNIHTLYTISNYIPRYGRNKSNINTGREIGLKKIGDCEKNISAPYNRLEKKFNILYTIICLILNVFIIIISAINVILGFLNTIINAIPGLNNVDLDIELPFNGVNLSPEEWKISVLRDLANFFNVISKLFVNDFLTGSLYHPRFFIKTKYKRRKKKIYEKYCSFDCRETGLTSDDPKYINKCKRSYIVDDDDYNTGSVVGSYFDVNRATEVISPASDGRGLIVDYENQFYYAARNDIDINLGVNAPELSFDSTGVMDKDKLFFATTFTKMGGTRRCSISGEPLIFDFLEDSSYNEDNVAEYLYDVANVSNCFTLSGISSERVYNISKFGNQVLSEDEDDIGTGNSDYYITAEDVNVKKYLCESFSLFQNNYTHEITQQFDITDNDGNIIEIIEDRCKECETDSTIRNISPYFHMFGVLQGKTSLDVLKEKYFNKCTD
jgi:hypothetical protein